MKRSMASQPDLPHTPKNSKKLKFKQIPDQIDAKTDEHIMISPQIDFDCDSEFAKLDENLLYEVFKHTDAKTLAIASCVSKQWHRTGNDERLWEMICTRHWSNSSNCSTQQLRTRSVVLALGGFRRLYALYLSKTAPTAPPMQARVVKGGGKSWGKDEVNLSLCLLSIGYFEKMNLANKRQ
ncbi:hypothetical protein BVRB_015500 [Beta vulgaris subsp. vulgaris]|uniref:F-box protein GID2 n=1 Tax=Beta vulgaris subsp. vulgaris TaxID=3555 RepID=A0A0J8DV96_BETVV|nr:hypothetical protein BVRB_015500 [Beta vulgaris subsp. vulgaris]